MASRDDRFFLNDWTLRVPIPSTASILVVQKVGPSTALSLANLHHTEETEETRKVQAERIMERMEKAKTLKNSLQVVAFEEINSQLSFVGGGGIMQLPNSEPSAPTIANVGIELVPGAQGRGIGKVFLPVLLRLACELHVDIVEAGTMKENTAMRSLARRLGLVETLEDKLHPWNKDIVVANVMYLNIPVWNYYESVSKEEQVLFS